RQRAQPFNVFPRDISGAYFAINVPAHAAMRRGGNTVAESGKICPFDAFRQLKYGACLAIARPVNGRINCDANRAATGGDRHFNKLLGEAAIRIDINLEPQRLLRSRSHFRERNGRENGSDKLCCACIRSANGCKLAFWMKQLVIAGGSQQYGELVPATEKFKRGIDLA